MGLLAKYDQKNILIVDDERIILKMLQKVLKKNGYGVTVGTNGKEAINTAMSTEIDLIVLDIMMPIMDGFETLRILKSMERTRRIPVIILTANSNMNTFSRVVQLGADDFIAKPFDQVNLRRKVDFLLQDAERRQEELDLLLENDTNNDDESIEFRTRRGEFIVGFERLFPRLVFLASNQKAEALQEILTPFEKKCEHFKLEKASLLSLKILHCVNSSNDWPGAIRYLEDLYSFFQNYNSQVAV